MGVGMGVGMRVAVGMLEEQVSDRQRLGEEVDVGPTPAPVLVRQLGRPRQAGGERERDRAEAGGDAASGAHGAPRRIRAFAPALQRVRRRVAAPSACLDAAAERRVFLTPPWSASIVRPRVSDFSQSYSTRIAAPMAECFAVLTDFAAYPQWSGPVRECRVLDRHPDGLARRVAFALDFTLKTVRYVLEYAYDAPRGARWHLVEGDLKAVEGSYRFVETGDHTEATCSQAVDIGFWVPGPLRRPFEQKALRDSVEEFKRAVEARAANRS
jgi:hypothetical protein